MLTLLACFLRKCYCSAGNDLDINRGDVVRQIWKTSALFQFAGIFVFLEFLSHLFVDFFLPDLGLDNSGCGEFFKFRNSVERTGAERLAGGGGGGGLSVALQSAGGEGPVGGPGGLSLTGGASSGAGLQIKLELPPGVEGRGGAGGVAARLGLSCREVVTGVATAAVRAVEVALQGAPVDLAALVAPQVLLESLAVGCLDLP